MDALPFRHSTLNNQNSYLYQQRFIYTIGFEHYDKHFFKLHHQYNRIANVDSENEAKFWNILQTLGDFKYCNQEAFMFFLWIKSDSILKNLNKRLKEENIEYELIECVNPTLLKLKHNKHSFMVDCDRLLPRERI
ncbi:unnamed protein product [Didymodactylos carnosus]|uniref:Uncharacterized protein n=1 Tax=Didymodactylos carnosus TaxID=1234261 RepID=A0A8S2DVH1_9BILA|nr:unnamed protein product [Didymodactylos carnosus]CAF3780529.1 unnamed protein product [Didymodactylos carnosus]